MPRRAQSSPCALNLTRKVFFFSLQGEERSDRCPGGGTTGGRKGTSIISSLILLFFNKKFFPSRAVLGKVKGAPVREEKSAW